MVFFVFEKKRCIYDKTARVDFVVIDAARINDACRNYYKWKSLNDGLTNGIFIIK